MPLRTPKPMKPYPKETWPEFKPPMKPWPKKNRAKPKGPTFRKPPKEAP